MTMKKKIILQKDVPNLGIEGDVADVAAGYARNYLLPRKLAVVATAKNIAILGEKKEKFAQDKKEKLAQAQEMSKKIQEQSCVLAVRAGKDGKLFGSITSGDVASFFNSKGLPLDKRWVELREPIRTTGEFSAAVRLHPQVRATFKIVVNSTTA
jgi:large subunit ribosomal protein L9